MRAGVYLVVGSKQGKKRKSDNSLIVQKDKKTEEPVIMQKILMTAELEIPIELPSTTSADFDASSDLLNKLST